MRIDCHVHTSRYSACSSLQPAEACRAAMARGLDAIVLTEHHRRWSGIELDVLRARFPTLALYAGVEVTLREGYDLVIVSGEELSLKPFVSFAEVRDVLAATTRDSFVFVAHPFRYSDRLDPVLEEILAAVDGIEMNSVNIMRGGGASRTDPEGEFRPRNGERYEFARETYCLIPVYNSDAHSEAAVGAIFSLVEAEDVPEDEGELARLLKAAKPREGQNCDLLDRIFLA